VENRREPKQRARVDTGPPSAVAQPTRQDTGGAEVDLGSLLLGVLVPGRQAPHHQSTDQDGEVARAHGIRRPEILAGLGNVELLAVQWAGPRGVLTLRIVQKLEVGRTLSWYGPACFSGTTDKPWLAMKVLPVGGLLWRWQFDFLESLRLPDPESK